MNLRARLLVAACGVAFAASLSARAADDDVRVTFANGRVTVVAEHATVSDILREWARVGGSTFINADRIPATERLTLRLDNEPELRAIEVLLRSVAGYVVAPRADARAASSIGNVLIMPVSRAGSYAQAPPAPAPPPVSNQPETPQLMAGPPQPDDDGPVRQEMPPAAGATPAPQPTQGPAPLGQASPLQGTQTQTVPGLGAVTSSQPGGAIQPPQRPGGRPFAVTPTQPRRGGGGG